MPEEPKQRASEEVVLVGHKPNMAYVMAAMTQFKAGRKEVFIKARGKSVSKCVDVAEIIRRKFLPGVKYKTINIGSEDVVSKTGQKLGVSTMEIVLAIEQ